MLGARFSSMTSMTGIKVGCWFVFGVLSSVYVENARSDADSDSYIDGRSYAKHRLEATDQGVVIRHGSGPADCDVYGAREAIVFRHKEKFYMHYDGAEEPEKETMIVGDLDLAEIRQQRLNNRMFHQRRPEIYQPIIQDWRPWEAYPDLKPFQYESAADTPASDPRR